MSRSRRRAGATSALVAALMALVVDLGGAALAAPALGATASPSPTLPRPTDVVDPDLSVGGPLLASMGVVVDLPPGVPAPPKVRDVSWLIADADTGEVLAAKAPHARLLPASTAKVLTALTLLPKIPPTTGHVTTVAETGADGTRVGLVVGVRYTARQLFLAMLMASANDAAYALADINGGHAATLVEMNALAARLGAHDTMIADPAGLDAPGQSSSAYDLALLGRAALADPDFREYSTTLTARFPGKPPPTPTPGQRAASPTARARSYQVQNHDKLLTTYPGAIGVKNGFTEAAQRTNIAAATRNGHTYIVTEMHSLDYGWVNPPKLLDWAFAYGTVVTPVGRLVDPGEVPLAPSHQPTPALGAQGTGVAVVGARPARPGPMVSIRWPELSGAAVPYAGAGGLALGGLAIALVGRRARRGARHR